MKRSEVERTIVEEMTKRLIAAGWNPTYHNATDDMGREPISTLPEVMEAVFSVDECHVWFKKEQLREQWVFLVLGEGGYDVICDHTAPYENQPEHEFAKIMDSMLDFAEELHDKHED